MCFANLTRSGIVICLLFLGVLLHGCATNDEGRYLGEAHALLQASRVMSDASHRAPVQHEAFSTRALKAFVLSRRLAFLMADANKHGTEWEDRQWEEAAQLEQDIGELGYEGLLGCISVSFAGEPGGRATAALEIGKVLSLDRELTVDILLVLLNDEDYLVRTMAVSSLQHTRRSRERVLTHLAVRLINEPHIQVRKIIAKAIVDFAGLDVAKDAGRDELINTAAKWVREKYELDFPRASETPGTRKAPGEGVAENEAGHKGEAIRSAAP